MNNKIYNIDNMNKGIIGNNNIFNDNSINDNSVTVINNYTYTELSKKELKESKLKEQSARFGLATLCGESVRCYGILIDNIIGCKDNIDRSTVINLIDLNTGKYLSDHININKSWVKRVYNGRLTFIEIYGRVYKYDDGNDRFAIDPTQLKNGYIKRASQLIINPYNTIDYVKMNTVSYTEMDEIEDWLQYDLNTNELKVLIKYLKIYINRLTKTDIHEDFLYNYIINNYLLNSSQFELFYKEIPMNKLNKNHYVELIYLLSNVIIMLSKNNDNDLITVLNGISKLLLSFMGVVPKLDYKKLNPYNRFKHSLSVSDRQMDYVVNNIMNNFKIHQCELQYKNELIKEACHFLKPQMENLNRRIERMRDNEI